MAVVLSSQAAYVLSYALTRCEDDTISHQPWLWEHDRWKELVFALLTRTSRLQEAQLRKVTEQLATLNLLAPFDLATLARRPQFASSKLLMDRIHRVLKHGGMSKI